MKSLSLARRAALIVAAATSLFVVACGADSGQPTYTGTDIELNAGEAVAAVGGCQTGDTRACTISLGEHGGIENCVEGLDVCSAGEWTGCIDEASLAENPELVSQLSAN
ncbi:MAG TPA: hypothetical protein VNN80_20650 [Polyangiaceae bacterium]|jgi:hypothetical protein|nr:hypothetical protein [Polyangiaceae bacterium]